MNTAQLTLDDANALLRDSGLPWHFTEGLLTAALERHTGHRIRDAIGKAPSDVGARRFVERLVDGQGEGRARRGRSGAHRNGATRPHGAARLGRSPAPPGDLYNDSRPLPDELPTPTGDAPGPSRGSPRSRVPPERDPVRYPLTFKAYGRKAALEFRAHTSRKGVPTVMLEGARARGEQSYDWANKVSVMMMPRELPTVAGVLLGALPACEFSNHGPQKNKRFLIRRQDDGFFVRVTRSGDADAVFAVPVPHEEAFYVGALVLRQIQRGLRGMDSGLVTAALRAYAGLKRTGGRTG